jgi:multicomponent Na+:H+ antiporter subunit F
VNMFGTKTVLLFSVIAFLAGRPDFLDLALAYALINFIGVLAVLEFFRSRAARRAEERRASGRSAAEPHSGEPG